MGLRKLTDLIVLHRAEVGFEVYNFQVSFDGTVLQHVPFQEKAAHARKFNGRSVGIAVQGDFASLEPAIHGVPTQAQLASVEQLIRDLVWWFGPCYFHGHSELGPDGTTFAGKLVAGHTCPGERYPLEALRESLKGIII